MASGTAEKIPGTAAGRLVRDGLAIDFTAKPLDGATQLMEGGDAEVRFKITDLTSGQPVSGLVPGVWLDLGQVIAGRDGEQKECKDKIALYLKGVVGIRPMLDLNGYYLLLLNKDSSITVIDPVVSVAGKTSTFTSILLRKPPMDWAKSTDGKRLYVSMPVAGQVAVIDTTTFKVVRDVEAGAEPVRVALQPDGRYLWVGNNGRKEETSGVTVIDTQSDQVVLRAATGAGHHEIVFSDDSRHAFVSNRDAGTVSVFDVATLKLVTTLKTGPRPISLAWSALSGALYVSDGRAGTVTSVDGKTLATRKVVTLKPGLGPTRLTPDGRFALALNTVDNRVAVIDAAGDELIHELTVTPEPYQISFTRGFAYVRGLASEKVTMINLGSLGKDKKPIVQGFAAGDTAPKLAGDLPIADAVTPAKADAAVFVVNPVDNTTYFYMEGMNAPMAGYPNRGHTARAATVVDRSIREVAPGEFASRVRWPTAGKFDVAFLLDRPRVLHCFTAEVQPSPVLEQKYATPKATLLVDTPLVSARSTVPVRIRLTQGRAETPRVGVGDVTLRYFLAPSSPARQVVAREIGAGLYEAAVEVKEVGAYYLYVSVPSLKIGANDQPFATLRAVAGNGAPPVPAAANNR